MLTNAHLSELLARRAQSETGHWQRALKKAARRSLTWPYEAHLLWAQGQPLQKLEGVGPVLSRLLGEWFEQPPDFDDWDPLRAHFLTWSMLSHPWKARGDLQMHTVWSDGSSEISDMAEAARARGYEYIAITDHAGGLKIANGLSTERLAAQGQEIEALNARSQGFVILRSVEANLAPDGSIDVQDTSRLDLVLACFHSKLRLPEDQTERYLAALRNPKVHILGHPRGRIFNFRLGLRADWKRVFGLAAELDKAVEIDCFPDRQDLDLVTLELARQSGVRISLGTDAHAAHQLHFMELGLEAAYRAHIPSERILNMMSAAEIKRWTARS
ncbi:MAG: PHP domain-containing protein [Candidatus Eremiobacteraeota bacterium]|nr:PHP domain-containing protein [Candidatus Eremiobacteraeota bacterium]